VVSVPESAANPRIRDSRRWCQMPPIPGIPAPLGSNQVAVQLPLAAGVERLEGTPEPFRALRQNLSR